MLEREAVEMEDVLRETEREEVEQGLVREASLIGEAEGGLETLLAAGGGRGGGGGGGNLLGLVLGVRVLPGAKAVGLRREDLVLVGESSDDLLEGGGGLAGREREPRR